MVIIRVPHSLRARRDAGDFGTSKQSQGGHRACLAPDIHVACGPQSCSLAISKAAVKKKIADMAVDSREEIRMPPGYIRLRKVRRSTDPGRIPTSSIPFLILNFLILRAAIIALETSEQSSVF
jgi:hypothetical protein